MKKDLVKGRAQAFTGKMQEAAGKLLDNKNMQAKGLQKQVIGNAETAISEAKKSVQAARDMAKRT